MWKNGSMMPQVRNTEPGFCCCVYFVRRAAENIHKKKRRTFTQSTSIPGIAMHKKDTEGARMGAAQKRKSTPVYQGLEP